MSESVKYRIISNNKDRHVNHCNVPIKQKKIIAFKDLLQCGDIVVRFPR